MNENATEPVDGRTQRRHRNIDAVVNAVLALAEQGNLDATSEEIAAVAGISHRSIYRYFESRTELLESAVVRAFDAASAEVFGDTSHQGSFGERVERFVSARLEIYHRLRAIARVAYAHAPRASPGIERARLSLRMRIAETFAEEFDRLDPDERELVIPVVDAVFQFEALEYLSLNAGLDEELTRKSLERHMHCHLAGG